MFELHENKSINSFLNIAVVVSLGLSIVALLLSGAADINEMTLAYCSLDGVEWDGTCKKALRYNLTH